MLPLSSTTQSSVQHRVAPTSSGLSFRELPESSFQQIRLTCKHYLEKGAGSYSPSTKAGRYLYDLANEVMGMVDQIETKLSKRFELKNQQIESVNRLLDEYRSVFKSGNEISPIQLLEELEKEREVNEKLKLTLAEERLRHAEIETDLYQMIDQYSQKVNRALNRDKVHMESVEVHIQDMEESRIEQQDTIRSLKELLEQKEEEIRILHGQISTYKHQISVLKKSSNKDSKPSQQRTEQPRHDLSTQTEIIQRSPVVVQRVANGKSQGTSPLTRRRDESIEERLNKLSITLQEQEKDQIQLLERAVKNHPL